MENSYEIISKFEGSRREIDELFAQRVSEKNSWLIDKLFELADGLWILQRTPDGAMIKTYRRPPDTKAIQYLYDRAVGKPLQKVESNRTTQGVIAVQHIIKSFADERRQQIEAEVNKTSGLDNVSERPGHAVSADANTGDDC